MTTAVVTGGSAGIGLAIAERLARSGWDVAILAREPQRLEQARLALSRFGTRILAVSTDVADAKAVGEAAAKIEAELGPIDAWVNNAMSTVVAKADCVTPEEYARVTATTYLSQVHGTLAALRFMKPRGRGAIIQISSGLGIRAAPMQAAYCAAKAAVAGFTDSLRAELIADGSPVTLSVVYLPAVNTPQPTWSRNHTGHEQVIPDPLYDPRLCAEAVLAAIKKGHREIWVGKTTVQMALAQVIAPSFADCQASGFIQAQTGDATGNKEGNLFDPVDGDARIDGDGMDRVLPTRSQFVTSDGMAALKIAIVSGIFISGAAVGVALTRRKNFSKQYR